MSESARYALSIFFITCGSCEEQRHFGQFYVIGIERSWANHRLQEYILSALNITRDRKVFPTSAMQLFETTRAVNFQSHRYNIMSTTF